MVYFNKKRVGQKRLLGVSFRPQSVILRPLSDNSSLGVDFLPLGVGFGSELRPTIGFRLWKSILGFWGSF